MSGMNCLKCGVEIQSPDVFCKACLGKMQANPVRPDAVIHIPVRPALPVEKPEKKKRGFADYTRSLRRTIKVLCVIITIMTLLICLLCTALYRQLQDAPDVPAIGKNYTTTERQDP